MEKSMCTKMFHFTPGETQSIMMASTPRLLLQILSCSFQYWVRARVVCLAYSSLGPRPRPAFHCLQYPLLLYHTGSNGTELGGTYVASIFHTWGNIDQALPLSVSSVACLSCIAHTWCSNRSSDTVKQYHYMVQMQPFNSTNTNYMAILTTTLVH